MPDEITLGASGADLDYVIQEEDVASEFPYVEPGVYPATITEGGDYVATTGTLMATFRVRIPAPVLESPVTMRHDVMLPQSGFSPGKFWSWGLLCDAAKVDPKGKRVRQVFTELVGKRVGVTVDDGDYEDKNTGITTVRSYVTQVLPITAVPQDKLAKLRSGGNTKEPQAGAKVAPQRAAPAVVDIPAEERAEEEPW